MEQMNRILVFTTNWLGDALFLTPFVSTLKENFPEAYLAVLVVPRVKDVFQTNPYVDKIIIYSERNKRMSLGARLGLILKLRREKFDSAFIIKPSLTRTILLKLSGIKKIIGFDNLKNRFLLSVRVPQPRKPLHRIDYFLTILEFLGLKVNRRRYVFFTSDEDRVYIQDLFLQKKINRNLPLFVINPGANWFPKRWPEENFAELIKRIKQRLSVNIVVSGAARDRILATKIINKTGEGVFDFTGETSIGQLGALMQEADLVISADSGPMHIAAAVGARLIALFGPTSPVITGPYPLGNHIIIQKDVGCKIPCYEKNCQDYRCMKAITVGEVIDKIEWFIMK